MTLKQALPIFWKYLAVVAMSCMLALVISNEGRAQERPASAYADAGGLPVETVNTEWRDAARGRTLPVRVVAPGKATDGARFPVILFSHGLGGSREGGRLWAEHWASHGYLVIVLQHPGSDEAVWKGSTGTEAAAKLRAAASFTNLGLRAGDVQFAIDEATRRAKAGEGVFAHADISRVGLSGHSFGAQTTLAVSGQTNPAVRGQSALDTRVVAAIAFSPNARNKKQLDRQFGDIRIPFFSITGSADGAVLDDGTEPADRTLPYRHMPAGGKYLVVFAGGDHMVFGGHALRGKRSERRDREIQRHVKSATLAFWQAHLRNDADARRWLENDFAATLAPDDLYEWK